jgi:hypothetical protein
MALPEETIACTLEGKELEERVRAWSEIASQARDRKFEPGRIVSVYPRDAALLMRLEQLIAAEAECCPFLKFNIEDGDDSITVELRLPEELMPVFAGLLGIDSEGL